MKRKEKRIKSDLIKWSGYEWLDRERWGRVHPENYIRGWNDPGAIQINRDGHLVLQTRKNPREFEINGKKVISHTGIGLVSNTTKFVHGYFEIEAKLPTGKNLWPAFWMWSFDSWPPEIDVFEAYTNKKKGYFKLIPAKWWRFLGFWNVQTNVHYGHKGDGTQSSIKGETHWMGFKNPRKHFIKYGCLWAPDKIEIFYNGRSVRTIKDKKVLKYFENTTMNVIINNHVDESVNLQNPTESEFIVKYFKYTPLKDYTK